MSGGPRARGRNPGIQSSSSEASPPSGVRLTGTPGHPGSGVAGRPGTRASGAAAVGAAGVRATGSAAET